MKKNKRDKLTSGEKVLLIDILKKEYKGVSENMFYRSRFPRGYYKDKLQMINSAINKLNSTIPKIKIPQKYL